MKHSYGDPAFLYKSEIYVNHIPDTQPIIQPLNFLTNSPRFSLVTKNTPNPKFYFEKKLGIPKNQIKKEPKVGETIIDNKIHKCKRIFDEPMMHHQYMNVNQKYSDEIDACIEIIPQVEPIKVKMNYHDPIKQDSYEKYVEELLKKIRVLENEKRSFATELSKLIKENESLRYGATTKASENLREELKFWKEEAVRFEKENLVSLAEISEQQKLKSQNENGENYWHEKTQKLEKDYNEARIKLQKSQKFEAENTTLKIQTFLLGIEIERIRKMFVEVENDFFELQDVLDNKKIDDNQAIKFFLQGLENTRLRLLYSDCAEDKNMQEVVVGNINNKPMYSNSQNSERQFGSDKNPSDARIADSTNIHKANYNPQNMIRQSEADKILFERRKSNISQSTAQLQNKAESGENRSSIGEMIKGGIGRVLKPFGMQTSKNEQEVKKERRVPLNKNNLANSNIL